MAVGFGVGTFGESGVGFDGLGIAAPVWKREPDPVGRPVRMIVKQRPVGRNPWSTDPGRDRR